MERDAVELETSSRPSKQDKVETSVQVTAVRDQHEDEEFEFSFQDDEVDMLEGYDNATDDEDYDLESGTCNNSEIDELIFEFTPNEPNLSEQELKVLDDVADRVEIQRLRDMQVLLLVSDASEPSVVPQNLSTRFVRTWRERILTISFAAAGSWHAIAFGCAQGCIGWSSVSSRMRHAGYILSSIGRGDAFRLVLCEEAMQYQLGRALPGQRTGSQLWYEAIKSLFCKEADMVQRPESPNLLRSVGLSCYILLCHVDDMVCGKADSVDNRFFYVEEASQGEQQLSQRRG